MMEDEATLVRELGFPEEKPIAFVMTPEVAVRIIRHIMQQSCQCLDVTDLRHHGNTFSTESLMHIPEMFLYL